jgi:hypothetical protein
MRRFGMFIILTLAMLGLSNGVLQSTLDTIAMIKSKGFIVGFPIRRLTRQLVNDSCLIRSIEVEQVAVRNLIRFFNISRK